MILPLSLDRYIVCYRLLIFCKHNMTNHFSREVDALQLGIYQLTFACVYATIGTFLFETLVLSHSSIQWFALLTFQTRKANQMAEISVQLNRK